MELNFRFFIIFNCYSLSSNELSDSNKQNLLFLFSIVEYVKKIVI